MSRGVTHMIEELATWVQERLDVPTFIYEKPRDLMATTYIILRRSGGPRSRGSVKSVGVDVWIYSGTLRDTEDLYQRASDLLKQSTRSRAIVSVSESAGPRFNIDDQQRKPHVWTSWAILSPRVRRTRAPG